jgi:hypothetical protein
MVSPIITKTHIDDMDRYQIDFSMVGATGGYVQIDTVEDASWFGMWLDSRSRRLVIFAEGDLEVRSYDSDADLVTDLEHLDRRYVSEGRRGLRFDPWTDELTAAVNAMGVPARMLAPASAGA